MTPNREETTLSKASENLKKYLELYAPTKPFSSPASSVSISEESVRLNPIDWSLSHQLQSGKRIDGKFEGYCTLSFENGDTLECRFEEGIPKGPAVIGSSRLNIDKLCANFVNNKLNGPVKVVTTDTSVLEGFLRNDVLSGPARRVEMRRFREFRRQTTFIGSFNNGRKHGPSWNYTEGGGYVFLYSSELDTKRIRGAFIYPDLSSAYVGYFSPELHMVSASPARLVGLNQISSHMMVPDLVVTNSDVNVGLAKSSTSSVGPLPLVSDPYEGVMVRVDTSSIASGGQGLFVKRNVEKGAVIAFYNGVRIPFKLGGPKETWATSGYKIFINADFKSGERMDIPQHLTSTDKYRATLAHKVNHSFTPNCESWFFAHPRHDVIPCLRTCRAVAEGEELTLDYDYDPFNCPEWFEDALRRFVAENEDYLNEVLSKKYWPYVEHQLGIHISPLAQMVPQWSRRK